MKEFLKISGRRLPFPAPSLDKRWTFSPRPGGWVICESSDGVRLRMMFAETRGRIGVNVIGPSWGTSWSGEMIQDRGSLTTAGEGGGDSDLIAQFPGKVRKVLVVQGTPVKEGDPLLLVEAMKMEFAIKAPFDGKVGNILVKEGQQLSPGDRFLDLEQAGGE